MRVLVTGAAGMLGRAVVAEFKRRGHPVFGFDRSGLDITDAAAVQDTVERIAPSTIVQCAAYTDVDGAEDDFERASEVNATGSSIVATACQEMGASFVYPSTDYVFSGESNRPWKPDDTPDPINAYGESKRLGEVAALASGRGLVVRTSWLYGSGGKNFVDTMLRLGHERDRLEVVDDQIGRPTFSDSLAWTIAELVESDASGIFHASDGGDAVSWFAFASYVLHIAGIAVEVVPTTTDAFPRPARRPRYSVLNCSETERVLGRSMTNWRDAVGRYLATRSVASSFEAE